MSLKVRGRIGRSDGSTSTRTLILGGGPCPSRYYVHVRVQYSSSSFGIDIGPTLSFSLYIVTDSRCEIRDLSIYPHTPTTTPTGDGPGPRARRRVRFGFPLGFRFSSFSFPFSSVMDGGIIYLSLVDSEAWGSSAGARAPVMSCTTLPFLSRDVLCHVVRGEGDFWSTPSSIRRRRRSSHPSPHRRRDWTGQGGEGDEE